MNAQSLRKNMTKEERHLWHDFLKTYPVKFYRQRRIDNFIVDFYCNPAKLIIEIDGGQHYDEDAMQYDINRTKILTDRGIHVIRFTNLDIAQHFKEVCMEIDLCVQARLLKK